MIRMAVTFRTRQRLAAALHAVGFDRLAAEASNSTQSRPWRSRTWVESAVLAAIVGVCGPLRGRRQLKR